MKKFIAIVLVVLAPLAVMAQKPGDRAYITDPTKIFRTYNFTADDDDVFKKTYGKDKDKISVVKIYSQADKWPRSITMPKGFKDNQDTIKKYVAYMVCELPGKRLVLHVPAADNDEFSVNLRPKTDFYFVIHADGVEWEEPIEKKK